MHNNSNYIAMNAESKSNKLILGVVLLLVGAALMFKNLGLIPSFPWIHIFISWKMLLVALGLVIIVSASNKIPGIILITIGGMFILQDVGIIPVLSFWRVIVPILLIVIGITIIFSKSLHPRGFNHGHHHVSFDMIDEVAILGGSKKIITSDNFKGGKMTAILGGGEFDLTQCQLAPGNNVFELVAIFGGVSLFVPEDWTIKIDVVSILGGFSDSRKTSRILVKDESKVLIIKGFVLFGGGELK
jgi:predicted membrane protein